MKYRLAACLFVLAGAAAAQPSEWTQRLQALGKAGPTWFELTSEETLGDRSAVSKGPVVRLGPDSLRIEVDEGTGAGGVAVLRGARATVWRRGWLSFVHLTYDRTHARVRSLRDHGLGEIGFFDEARWILENPAEARWEDAESGGDAFAFTDRRGLRHEVHWPRGTPHPLEDRVFDGAERVERYAYQGVRPATAVEVASVRR